MLIPTSRISIRRNKKTKHADNSRCNLVVGIALIFIGLMVVIIFDGTRF